MKTLFSNILSMTAREIAFTLSVFILCSLTIESRATDFQIWSEEAVATTLSTTIDGISITSTEGGLNNKNQTNKCLEISEELGLPTTKIFMPSLKSGTMLTIDVGSDKKITGLTLYIARNNTGESVQCGHGAFSEDNSNWTDFADIEAKGYDYGTKIAITPSGSSDYRYFVFGRGKIGDVAATLQEEFRIYKIIVTTADVTPIDDTCGPTITKGAASDWAGGANYTQGDVPSLTFEVIAEASNGGELTYQWFQYFNNDPETAEKATGSTNSNTYTPQTDIVHDGYIYYCEVREKGCGKVATTARTGTVTVVKGVNRAIADWADGIGTFTIVSSTDGISIDKGQLKFGKSYKDEDNDDVYDDDQYVIIEPKEGITSFGPLDTIYYSEKLSDVAKTAQLVICNAENQLIYIATESATGEYIDHKIILPADMEKTSSLRIGRAGGTAYYINDFRVYAYNKPADEPTLKLTTTTDTEKYTLTISATPSSATQAYMYDIVKKSDLDALSLTTPLEIATYIGYIHKDDPLSWISFGNNSREVDLSQYTAGDEYVIGAFYIDPSKQTIAYESAIQVAYYTIPEPAVEPQQALYDITFKDNRKNDDASVQLTEIKDIVLSDNNLLESVSANFVYNAKKDHGVKLGKQNETGSLTLTLAKTTALSSIEVFACAFKDGENTLVVKYGDDEDTETLTLDETMSKQTIDCKGKSVSTITLTSGTRCYIGGLNLKEKKADLPTKDYQIIFKDKSTDEANYNADATKEIGSSNVSDFVTTGADLISSIDESALIFTARNGLGIRMGNSSLGGWLEMSLKNPINATKIVVNARGYTAGNKLIINDNEIVTTNAPTDFTINLDGSPLTKLEIEAEDCVYLIGLTITGSESTCQPQTKEVSATICEGDEYKWDKDGKTYTTSGKYSATVVEDGCDVTYNLTLTVNKATTETITHTAKGSYEWYGTTYTESGIFTHETTNKDGCKHTITLVLTIEPDDEPCTPTVNDVEVTICEGEKYTIGSVEYSTAGTYTIKETDENGCNITTRYILTVNPTTSATFNETAKGSYEWYGETYTVSGTYTHETTNAQGCKHIETLNLTIEPSEEPCVDKNETYSIAICEGEKYMLGDKELTTEGTHTATLKTFNGCDSVVTINLKVNKPTTEIITETAKGLYVWFGKTYIESGTYTHETTNADGCKHTITLDLTIEPLVTPCTPKEVTIKDTICQGERYYVGNNSFNATGTYTVKLTTHDGCDSIVNLNLTVGETTNEVINHTATNSYTWFDQTYTQSGIYTKTLVNRWGCDSTLRLILTIEDDVTPCEPKVEKQSVTICEGESYTYNGAKLTIAGEYNFPYKTADGCDSTFVLTLNINKPSYKTLTETAEGSYTWFGRELTQSGRYTEKLTNHLGCDSIITLILTIQEPPQPCTTKYNTLNEQICQGSSYEFNGQTLTQADTYQATLKTATGCDSIVTLNLKVIPTTYSTISHKAIGYYTWFGKLYTQSGQYQHTIPNAAGCDSIITLQLTVLTEDTVKPCEPIAFTAVSDNSEAGNVVIVQEPTCENGNTAVVSAETNNGWHFTKWSDDNQSTLRILPLTEPLNLIAYFEKDVVPCRDYVIMVFNSNEEAGEVSVVQTPNCDNGNEAIVSAVAFDETKYKFSKWSDGSTDATHTLTLTRNFAITAQWEKVGSDNPDNPDPSCEPYKLTVNVSDQNAGIVNVLQSPNCNNNQTAILQVVTYAGYQFSQWEDGSTQTTRTIQLTSDMTVTATWLKEQDVCRTYTLTLRSDNTAHGTTNIIQAPDCKTNQNTAIFEAVAADNYQFDQWSDGNKDNPRTLTLASDLTLYANFNIRQYNLQATSEDYDKGTVTGSGYYTYNSSVTITAVPTPGYTFLQWSDGNTDNPRTVVVTENMALQAAFTEQYYNIHVSANDAEMGAVSGSGQYQAYTFATIKAEAFDGFTFVSWSDGNKQAERQVLVLSDMSYQAVFVKPSTYRIEVITSNEAMGTVEGGGYYAGGTEVTLTAVAKQGYHFIRWQDDVTDNPRTITVTRDATYYAYFWLGTDLIETNALADITISDMQIMIDGHEGETFGIWSATGQMIYSGTVQPVITLPHHGVFIIRLGDQVAKIVL